MFNIAFVQLKRTESGVWLKHHAPAKHHSIFKMEFGLNSEIYVH